MPPPASDDFKGKSKAGLYGDTIEEIDWSVGQINTALKKLGLAEKTLVVFTSDNGPWLSAKENGGCAKPLRSGKGTNYEGGQRVPCIMKMPGTIPAGTENGQLCTSLDLLPTLSKMAGISVEHSIDGTDISALLTSPKAKTPRNTFLYLYGNTPVAIRSGDWKLILKIPGGDYWLKGGETIPEGPFKPELYNLKDDIGETANLYSEHPEIAERLQKLFAEAENALH